MEKVLLVGENMAEETNMAAWTTWINKGMIKI